MPDWPGQVIQAPEQVPIHHQLDTHSIVYSYYIRLTGIRID